MYTLIVKISLLSRFIFIYTFLMYNQSLVPLSTYSNMKINFVSLLKSATHVRTQADKQSLTNTNAIQRIQN